MQVYFVVEEWVNHALLKSREVESELVHLDKALAEAKKKYKDSLFHLAEVEKGRKNVEVALWGFEKQAEELQVSLKKTKTQLALAKEQIKLQQKELEGNDAEKAKVEQVAYDAGITKTTQSLTAQLRDVARAFYLEVWGEAINAIVVGVNFDLGGPDKVTIP